MGGYPVLRNYWTIIFIMSIIATIFIISEFGDKELQKSGCYAYKK